MKSPIPLKPRLPLKPKPEPEPGICLNCGSYLAKQDFFCTQCGQKRIAREDMSFHHLIGDSFLDYFHFDSKFFRTIIPLMFRPGQLTLEYMKGKRKSYVEPFKLFLVISVIYFLLLPFGKEKEPENKVQVMYDNNARLVTNAKSGQKHFKYSIQGVQLSKSARDSIRMEIDSTGVKSYVEKHHAKESAWVKLFLRQVFKIMVSTGQSFTTVLEHTASKLIFILIPVFALLLKLFYLRRKRLYFEHLIFSLHLHAFFFLLFILYMIAELMIPFSFLYIIIIMLLYTFTALKRYYGQGYGKTLSKMILLSLSYLIIGLPMFVILLVLVAVMTF